MLQIACIFWLRNRDLIDGLYAQLPAKNNYFIDCLYQVSD